MEFEYYDGGTYWTQFQAKMAANSLTDVFQMGNNWLTYYDTIEPLNAYIDAGIIDTTAIGPAMIATTSLAYVMVADGVSSFSTVNGRALDGSFLAAMLFPPCVGDSFHRQLLYQKFH